MFDFPLLKSFLARSDFKIRFDGMHAITGAYAKPILVDVLGAKPDSVVNDTPLEDFGCAACVAAAFCLTHGR